MLLELDRRMSKCERLLEHCCGPPGGRALPSAGMPVPRSIQKITGRNAYATFEVFTFSNLSRFELVRKGECLIRRNQVKSSELPASFLRAFLLCSVPAAQSSSPDRSRIRRHTRFRE